MRRTGLLVSFIFSHAIILNAQSWMPVGTGTSGASPNRGAVQALYHDTVSDLLYAGGSFDSAGTIPVNHVAAWDGTNWHALGSGTYYFPVSCFIRYNGELYVGGNFD